jgi:hypothetical protein
MIDVQPSISEPQAALSIYSLLLLLLPISTYVVCNSKGVMNMEMDSR